MRRTRGNQADKSEFSNVDRWWEQRASIVTKKFHKDGPTPDHAFASPEDMWGAACEYFEWMQSRPQYETKFIQYKGELLSKEIPKKRPFTLRGLLLFMNISMYVWKQYKTNRGTGFERVCEQIESVLYQQKFEGAAVDLFNANIIARDLGLKDGQEISGPDGGPIQTFTQQKDVDVSNLSNEQLDNIINALDNREKERVGGHSK